MFERLVAPLNFPFLLFLFKILQPPNEARLAASAKTERKPREELIKMTSLKCAS